MKEFVTPVANVITKHQQRDILNNMETTNTMVSSTPVSNAVIKEQHETI